MADPADLDEESRQVLAAAFKKVQNDPSGAFNMWDLGQSLGIARSRMEDLAMGLVSEELLEIKSLNGKMALTEAGFEMAKAFSPGPVVKATPADLEIFINELSASLEKLGLAPQVRKDLEIDLSVLQSQLERSQRLTPVVDATLEAIREALGMVSEFNTASLLNALAVLKSGH